MDSSPANFIFSDYSSSVKSHFIWKGFRDGTDPQAPVPQSAATGKRRAPSRHVSLITYLEGPRPASLDPCLPPSHPNTKHRDFPFPEWAGVILPTSQAGCEGRQANTQTRQPLEFCPNGFPLNMTEIYHCSCST